MHKFLLATVAACLFAGIGAAQFHEPVWVFGGDSMAYTYRVGQGLYVGDAKTGKLTTLFSHSHGGLLSNYMSHVEMDVNNRDLIFSIDGTSYAGYNLKDGIFRYETATGAITTIASPTPPAITAVARGMVDQDGDYVYCASGILRTSPTTVYGYYLLKQGRLSGAVTTVFKVGRPGMAVNLNQMGINIDSGNFLLSGFTSSLTPQSPVLEIPLGGGKASTWNRTWYGWNGYATGRLEQNYATGAIQQVQGSMVHQLVKGSGGRTTLAFMRWPGGWTAFSSFSVGDRFDLRSAAQPRHVVVGYQRQSQTSPTTMSWHVPGVVACDASTPWASTATAFHPNLGKWLPNASRCDFRVNVCNIMNHRNLQTVWLSTAVWQLLVSVPHHAGKKYVGVVSASGIRPGVKLPDGRRIWLNPDPLTVLSSAQLLKPYFDHGPGVLDARGEAMGRIDCTRLPRLGGMPLWIAVAVLDPKAPGGIAFLPDTTVLRIP